ncbi:outer membrane porin, OprD family [Azotobacter beijerinckii]|uniref:Outer membrane porin, OprD family n=1 Tax=Azotobacter beijerinckii TaxID=170623 RepID=A0A1H6UE76_9GAMM|nr:OprD family porin [Azotobacter beijerinckii]SEI89916.1 outer membrane porin, OprD family [Azotobacter beijerinckii]
MKNSTFHLSSQHSLVIALSFAGVFLSAGAQATFVDDAKGTLNLRNYYMQRDLVDRVTQAKREEWTQSFILDLQSGYTEGPVGFGVDVLGLWAIKLDGGKGTAGTELLPVHDDGRPADEFGRVALAGKLRFSKTEVKIGEWSPTLPILNSNDARALPQTFQGGMLTVKEIPNFVFYGGQIRANSPRNDASMQSMSLNGSPNATSDRYNFGGIEYSFNDKRTQVSAWFGQLEDIYKQRYFEIRHLQPLGKAWSLSSRVGLFTGEEDGRAEAGDLDNKTLTGLFALKTGANTFTFAFQRLTGDDRWLRLNGTVGSMLPNCVFSNDYDNAREESWQVRHDYNFATLGIPGLTFMSRYVSGKNVHTATVSNGEEWSRENAVAYAVQSGTFKNLSIQWLNATRRSDFGTNTSWEENRLIVNYPMSLF